MLQRSESYTGNKGGECSPAERLAHLIRCRWECPYCGCSLQGVSVHIDHVVAQVWGGGKGAKNQVACCASCNCSKKHKLLADFAAGRGDMEIVRRVKKILNRRLPLAKAKKILHEAKPRQRAELRQTMAKKTTKNSVQEAKELPRNDSEVLDQLVEGLEEMVGLYDKIHEGMESSKERQKFEKDFGMTPEEALGRANDQLTMKVIQVRAQRVLIAEEINAQGKQ